MTFSIVARGADGKSFGVAVASKFLAVGAAVPAAEAGIGAIATQAYANLAYRSEGLAQLRAGRSAQLTLDTLVATDDKRESRQAGIVDAAGAAATFTGSECNPWAGGVTGDGYAIQGNILVGPEVVAAMEQAWLGSGPDEPLARRLLAGLTAGDDAGGDRRGRQSAALLVVSPEGGYGGGSDVLVDLRVDDHAAPVAELARLLDLHDLYFGKPDPDTLLDLEGDMAAEVRTLLASAASPTTTSAPRWRPGRESRTTKNASWPARSTRWYWPNSARPEPAASDPAFDRQPAGGDGRHERLMVLLGLIGIGLGELAHGHVDLVRRTEVPGDHRRAAGASVPLGQQVATDAGIVGQRPGIDAVDRNRSFHVAELPHVILPIVDRRPAEKWVTDRLQRLLVFDDSLALVCV